jgi:hypothetical protein
MPEGALSNDTEKAAAYLASLGRQPEVRMPSPGPTPAEAARIAAMEAIKAASGPLSSESPSAAVPHVEIPVTRDLGKVVEAVGAYKQSGNALEEIQAAILARHAKDDAEIAVNQAARMAVEGGAMPAPKPVEAAPEDGVVFGPERVFDMPKVPSMDSEIPIQAKPETPAPADGGEYVEKTPFDETIEEAVKNGITIPPKPLPIYEEKIVPPVSERVDFYAQPQQQQQSQDKRAVTPEAADAPEVPIETSHVADTVPSLSPDDVEAALREGKKVIVPEVTLNPTPKMKAPDVVLPKEDIRPSAPMNEKAVMEAVPAHAHEAVNDAEAIEAASGMEQPIAANDNEEAAEDEKGVPHSIEQNPLFAGLDQGIQENLRKIYATEPEEMGARLEWRLDHLDEITAAFKDGRAALEQKAIPTDPRARRAWLEKEMALLDTIEKMETDRVGATKRALKSLVEETIAKMDAAILAEEGKK